MPYPTQWADHDPNVFMCCLCFALFEVSMCAIDEKDGEKVDVCQPCWQHELDMAEKLRKRP